MKSRKKNSCWEEDEVVVEVNLSTDQRQIEELSLNNRDLAHEIVQADSKLWDLFKNILQKW